MEIEHWEALWKLGKLPLEIRALPEGVQCPIGVPFLTVKNTHKDFAWLVNFIETQISTCLWDMITVATISHQYRKTFDKYAQETSDDTSFVDWQGHDFSMRGRSSIETSYNQAGHLLSFKGTDTIPAVIMLEKYYNADMDKELIAGSVPASEHSVMMCLGKEGEIKTFKYLLDKFPDGILSVVSDTWNLWDVLEFYLPNLYSQIMGRNGKLVIRPDSGNPVDIICGKDYCVVDNAETEYALPIGVVKCKATDKYYQVIPEDNLPGITIARSLKELREVEVKGVVETLYETFGGTVNSKGYKVLDPHVGCIYGDSITIERAEEICERLKNKGFASTNWVAGIGSYTFNYNTRDTFGMAIKATNCTLLEDGKLVDRAIFKDPVTDSGEKRSAKGYLQVYRDKSGELKLNQNCTKDESLTGELIPVFNSGVLLKDYTLSEIRTNLEKNL